MQKQHSMTKPWKMMLAKIILTHQVLPVSVYLFQSDSFAYELALLNYCKEFKELDNEISRFKEESKMSDFVSD